MFAPRVLDLGDERTLTIRAATAGDVDRLAALYAELSEDDRYRRFFSGYRPDRHFVESWVGLAERGGCVLLAVVRDRHGERLVAEAGYAPQEGGRGELGVTVTEDWRGWLGPYLIDALVEAAAARGISTLEAEVLLENGPMQALLRGRGAVTLDRPDWSVVRIAIGTGAARPVWPPTGDRLHVLVEGKAGRWRGDDASRAAGISVIECPGPGDRPTRCPALRGAPCPLAEDADVIVLAIPPSDQRAARLLAAHRVLHPQARLAVDAEGGDEDAVDLTACTSGAELVRRLRELAATPAAGT
ncbi:MAG TPA: GNAT family N-acetyltransferase [Acidimicrobiales bacterium]|nr:GNAT family N-acetyltransferase [Acidimicrobiales bacterium]